MRRALLIGLAVVVVAAGLGWLALRPKGAGALASSCTLVRRAFGAHDRGTADALARATSDARRAARHTKSLAAYRDVLARIDTPPGPGVGAVASAADLASVDSTCKRPAVPPGAAVAARAPYLTDVTASSVLVNFATEGVAQDPTVTYGPAGSDCARSSAAVSGPPVPVAVGRRTEYLYSAEVTGLSPATRYCYRLGPSVFDLSTREVAPVFVTAAPPGDTRPFSFAVIGDWGGGTVDEGNVLARIAQSPASFVVTVGDNAYISGNQTDYGDLDGGHVFARALWPRVGGTHPTFAVQGNHGFSIYQPLLQNWPEPETVAASAGADERASYCCTPTLNRTYHYADTWYAFDWGNARFYVLDAAWADHTGDYLGDFLAHWNGPVAGCPACGRELQWLQADLAAHRATPIKLAFFHYPLHADASDHLSDTLLDGPQHLEGVLAAAGVRIVFNGHAHLYERNAAQIPGSDLVSYVTGGGGVGNGTDVLASVVRCSASDAYAVGTQHTSCHAPAPASDRQVYHFLLVTVNGNRVTVAPTDEDGRTFDVQTYTVP